jgi:hypothetical protein
MNSRTQGSRFSTGLAIVALGALLALMGCSKNSDDEAAAALAPNKAKPSGSVARGGKLPPAADDESRLANAVVSGKTSAPVDLKYDLAAKPAVGQPFEIELDFLPRLAADTLDVAVTGMPGLTLVGGGTVTFDKVQAGTTYTHKVLVQADADGTYYVSVIAKMITQVETEVRTFSVPVVVGTAPAVVAKPEPQKDASGQAIESLPAKEQ